MRVLAFFALLLSSTLAPAQLSSLKKSSVPNYELQTGDIVFQATGGHQCEAIRAATDSPYSHCGVVFSSNGKLHVLEAISPVRTTPLETFQRRSLRGTFHARRLKNAETVLTDDRLKKALAWTEKNMGKPYDGKFLWGDESLYCSELVWKLFHAAGNIKLSKPRPFDSFNLEPEIVQLLIVHRFGSVEAFPAKEKVVAPSDLVQSPLLIEVPKRQTKKKL